MNLGLEKGLCWGSEVLFRNLQDGKDEGGYT